MDKEASMAAAAGLKAAKAALRKEMRSKVATISAEEKVRQSKEVIKKVLADPIYLQAKSLSIYLNLATEIETWDILQDALKSGKDCFIPKYYQGKKMMDMVRLNGLEDFESLPMTKWQIKQPAEDDNSRAEAMECGGLDIMFVPGVAFTDGGKRLGHGMGYYDSYLTKISTTVRRPHVAALAFNEQVVADVPVGENDFIIDRVIKSG